MVEDIFILDPEDSIIHPDVYLISPNSLQTGMVFSQAPASTLLSDGERYEFIEYNYAEALNSYRQALAGASSEDTQAYIRMMIARCHFKMKDYTQAAESYRLLAETNGDERSRDGTPMKIIGLSRLAECYSHLNQFQNVCLYLFLLYEELISSPNAFESYDFYIQTVVKDELTRLSESPDWENKNQIQLDELKQKEVQLLRTVSFLETARSAVKDQLGTDSSFFRVIIQNEDSRSSQLACLPISSLDSTASESRLVYKIDKDFVSEKVLPELGGTDDIGKSIRVGIVSEEESFAVPEDTPLPSLGLASEPLVQYFPWWKIVLFDIKGKTVEQILRKEKRLYGGALLGIFVLIFVGAGLTLRAAVHEAEAARIKADFVSNVSHELKTPLALIRLFGETLEMEDIPDIKKRKKFSRIITRESQRLSHLVENVLDFSRIDAGRKEYNFEEADIVEVVSHTIEAYRYYLKDQDFEFVSSIPNKPIHMRIDKDSISQALLNLVSNAEKFSKDRKYIGVSMLQKDGEVWIIVDDKGPGIPDSSIKQIFDKFDRGAGPLARNVQGSGLGLTITKHIVEGHGGRVDVESRLDEGSRFIIKLPLKGEKA